jgi:hypothetical protein
MEDGLLDKAGYTADVSRYIQVVCCTVALFMYDIHNRISYIKKVKRSYYAAVTHVLFTFFSTKAQHEGKYLNDM